MLSQTSTQLIVALCDSFTSDSYKIMNWEDIASFINLESSDEKFKKIWDEIKLNVCVNVKYKDDDQVCFTMTDKARLLAQEIKAMNELNNAKEDDTAIEPMVKIDETGHNVVVLPGSKQYLEKVKQTTTVKKGGFLQGILGGILGGLISGGALWAILTFVIGG